MSREVLIIDFNKLRSSEITKGIEFVSIVKNGKAKRYKVVDTTEKLMGYLSKSTDYLEKQVGILVTCECINIAGIFHNAIFLEKFKIDSYSEPRIDDLLYLSFSNCDFFQDIELLGGDYKRIKINESIIRKNIFVRFVNCEKLRGDNITFKENIILENSEFGSFNVNASKIEDNLLFQEVNILNDFILDKVKGNKDLDFIDCRFEGLSKLESIIENF